MGPRCSCDDWGGQFLALKGIHIIPYQRLEKWLGKINYKSAILDNIAFKYVELSLERSPMTLSWALLLVPSRTPSLRKLTNLHWCGIELPLVPHSPQPPLPPGKQSPPSNSRMPHSTERVSLWRKSVGPIIFLQSRKALSTEYYDQ